MIVFVSGVCGSGKSTICEYIRKHKLIKDYSVFDMDELENINNYNENTYNLFYKNCVDKALEKSKNSNIILFSCINHNDIFDLKLDSSRSILITCSNEEITNRLKNRDKNRNCSDDSFINEQIKYQDWFISNSEYYDLIFDNTNISIREISLKIVDGIENNF